MRATDGASRVALGLRLTPSERMVHGEVTSDLFGSKQLLRIGRARFFPTIGGLTKVQSRRRDGQSARPLALPLPPALIGVMCPSAVL